jgi:hypothetical protein
MVTWEATLQGREIVLDLDVDGRRVSATLDRDEADELAQRLIELVIEGDLDECDDPDAEDWADDADDDEGEAA